MMVTFDYYMPDVMICIALFLPLYGCSFETRKNRFFLNDDGSLEDLSASPKCFNGSKIDLISYTYEQIICSVDEDCHTEQTAGLSPAAEFLLHTLCSWKEECDNLTFPLRTAEQTSRTNAVNLTYRCSDGQNEFINMCVQKVTHVHEASCITSDNTFTLFNECKCFVSKGIFSMTINDMRLTSKTNNTCSQAVLTIQSDEYRCEPLSGNYGSVFHRKVIPSDDYAFISLKHDTSFTIPDTVVLCLTPKDSLTVSCGGLERRNLSTELAEGKHLRTLEMQLCTHAKCSTNSNTSCENQTADTSNNELSKIASVIIALSVAIPTSSAIAILLYRCYVYRTQVHSEKTWLRCWLEDICHARATTIKQSDDDQPEEASVNSDTSFNDDNTRADYMKMKIPQNKQSDYGLISSNVDVDKIPDPNQTDSTDSTPYGWDTPV